MGNVRMTFTAEDAQAVRSFMRLENKQKALEQRQNKVNKTSKKGAKNASSGLKQWATRAATLATSYLGIYSAVNKARDAIRDMNRERQKGLRESEEQYKGMGSLAQLAESRGEMSQLMSEVKRSRAEEGMSAEEAGRLQFQLVSAGMGDQRELFASLQGLADPTEMVSSVKRMQGALGRDETGSAKELLDKMFVASGEAQATVDEIATGAVKAGKTTGAIGTTDEELLSAMAIGSSGQASVKETATRFRAFGKQVDKEDLGGEGMMDAMRNIRDEVEAGADVYDLLKSQRAVEGYRILRDQADEVSTLTGEIDETGRAAARAGGPIGARTRQAVGLKEYAFGDVRRKQRAEEREKMQQAATFGDEEAQRKAIMSELSSYQSQQVEEGKTSHLWSTVKDKLSLIGVESYMGRDPEWLVESIRRTYGQEAAARAARSAGIVYNPGHEYHMRTTRTDEQLDRYSMFGEQEIGDVNVQSDVRGAKVEHDIKVRDQRSPQSERKGGGAGVE